MSLAKISYLRSMNEIDLEEVLLIEQQAYDFPWSRRGFENSLDQGLNYVFCDIDGRIQGYSCFLTVLDEAHLLNFCIRPESQGKGMATLAFSKLLEHLLGADFNIVLLEVRESNHRARALYRKLGFREDGVRKDYYQSKDWDDAVNDYVESRENAILMSLPLGEDD